MISEDTDIQDNRLWHNLANKLVERYNFFNADIFGIADVNYTKNLNPPNRDLQDAGAVDFKIIGVTTNISITRSSLTIPQFNDGRYFNIPAPGLMTWVYFEEIGAWGRIFSQTNTFPSTVRLDNLLINPKTKEIAPVQSGWHITRMRIYNWVAQEFQSICLSYNQVQLTGIDVVEIMDQID